MSLIKIIANNIELDFVKESLVLKKENNSLSSDFKVTHSSFPFLIIENQKTKMALGSSDIASISKKKIIAVSVVQFGVKYYGELQQISVQKGYRKCNLKYSSELLSIINKSIAGFLPSVSVIPGEIDPIPFSTESEGLLPGLDNWNSFALSLLGKIYPEAKFQLPTLSWKEKFGTDLEADDSWYEYGGYLNQFSEDLTSFITNSFTISGGEATVHNKNVASPQVFLLTPLFYIFQSLQWGIRGNFVEHELIKRLLFLSLNDNTCNFKTKGDVNNVDMSSLPAVPSSGSRFTRKYEIVLSPGTYIVNYEISEPDYRLPPYNAEINPNYSWVAMLRVDILGVSSSKLYSHYWTNGPKTYKGTYEFTIDTSRTLSIQYINRYGIMPVHSMNYYIYYGKEFKQMHTTIELGRFVPNWTVGSYLNYLKNWFNLNIILDDFKKQVTINFNETINNFEKPVIINKSLLMNNYELSANTSFVLKYANSEDKAILINKEGVFEDSDSIRDDFTNVIESKFKIMPDDGVTTSLTENSMDKEGVGLMIYEPTSAPFTADKTISGFNLEIETEKGILKTFFGTWLICRLNASQVELNGVFTEVEITKIEKEMAVFVNNQRFRVVNFDFSENLNYSYKLKLVLESVTY